MTPSQQALLASLSVYKSGWPLEAAEAMADANAPGASARDLLALVDKSLVQRTDGVLGEPRFSMLHLLREFAGAQLDSSQRRHEVLNCHAASISNTVRSLESRRWAESGDSWIEAISAEHADVLAALTWCFSDGDSEVGCKIVAALGFWWYRSGRHVRGGSGSITPLPTHRPQTTQPQLGSTQRLEVSQSTSSDPKNAAHSSTQPWR